MVAGDSLVAGTMAALLGGYQGERAVAVGVVAAKHAVQAAGNAPEGLTWAAAEAEARMVALGDA
jgi:sugar/nucleoside kinase (ribokinase family)